MKWDDNVEARFFYRDREHQAAQLQAAVDHAGPLAGKSVLDVGCGYGDLLGLLPRCAYVGIDRDKRAIATARELWPDHEFHCTEAVKKADVVIAVASLQCCPNPRVSLLKWIGAARERLVVVSPTWEHLPEGRQGEEEWDRIVRETYPSDRDDFYTSVVLTKEV